MAEPVATSAFPFRRISVIGASGCGKTTFARALGAAISAPHVELDALHWQDNWTEAERSETHRRIADVVRGDAWVIDGNYRAHRDLIWRRAEAVVWLDYPRLIVHTGVVRRTMHRVLMQPALWNTNNRESLRRTFSRESVVLWSITSFAPRRCETIADLKDLRFQGLTLVRFRSRAASRRFLEAFGSSPAACRG